MHPNQWSGRIAMRVSPCDQPITRTTPAGHTIAHLVGKRRDQVNEWTRDVNAYVVDVLIEGHSRKYAYLKS